MVVVSAFNNPLDNKNPIKYPLVDKKNNKLENLFLTTVAEHNKLHAESESIIFELVKQGLVIFNRNTARYELVQLDSV